MVRVAVVGAGLMGGVHARGYARLGDRVATDRSATSTGTAQPAWQKGPELRSRRVSMR